MNSNTFMLRSLTSDQTYPITEIRYRCDDGGLLEVVNTNLDQLGTSIDRSLFTKRLQELHGPHASGVWRYRELVLPLPDEDIISKPEGNTNLYAVGADERSGYARIGQYAGVDQFYLKHEGENPTGSFKDRGMTAGASMAHALGANAIACASTGNTSAALASYGAQAGMKTFVFIPDGKIAWGKLSQSMAYGALTIQINGDFDKAMQLVEDVCNQMQIYLLNSVNPFRIEGQKTIAFELLHQLGWQSPDWIVLPAGNLGNTSAIGKGLQELYQIGMIDRIPRIASIQAAGANPFYQSYVKGFSQYEPVSAETIATAIRIGNPVSYLKAQEAIQMSDGVVEDVTDQEIVDAKAQIDAAGIGCEPASAATVAGLKKLVAAGTIRSSDRVAGILTGHVLKDPDTTIKYHTGDLPGMNTPYASSIIQVEPTVKAVEKTIAAVLADQSLPENATPITDKN